MYFFFEASNWRTSGEGDIPGFSSKLWDRRRREGLIDSATSCHDSLYFAPKNYPVFQTTCFQVVWNTGYEEWEFMTT